MQKLKQNKTQPATIGTANLKFAVLSFIGAFDSQYVILHSTGISTQGGLHYQYAIEALTAQQSCLPHNPHN